MFILKKQILLLLISLATLLVLAACGTATSSVKDEGNPEFYEFGAAAQGGGFYAIASAMSHEISKNLDGAPVTVVEGGAESNVMGLENGKFAIGLANGETYIQGLNGTDNFEKKHENVFWIATLYPNAFHIVVREDSDIYTLEDLKGKTINPGIKGYGGEILFKKVLEINDMSYDDIGKIEYVGTDDAGNLLRDNNIDAIAVLNAAPVSTFQDLATTVGIRIIPIPNETVEELNRENEGIAPYTLKKETYSSMTEDVNTFSANTAMLVSGDLSDEVVYEITKTVNEKRDTWETVIKSMEDFNSEYAIENQIGPIAPGAEKYYKEIGVLE